MKILHIDTGTVWRGGQRQVLTLHKGLLQNGVDSLLLCNQAGELHQACQKEKTPSCHGFDFQGEFSTKTHNQVKQQVKELKPSIIHCHDSHAVKLGNRFHRTHTLFHTRRVSYPIKFLSRYFKYRNISMHICVSEDIRQYMQQYFDHTTTIHSCIDLSRFDHTPQISVLKNPGRINILYVGAFTEQKGIDVLIKAFAEIHKQHPETMLHLVGDGKLFPKTQQLIHTLGIGNQTILYGARTDVEDFYLSSDLVVCPSVSGEGSSGVIKEGLAAGKTVIANSLEANKEIIENGIDGILYNGDYLQLSEMIQLYLTNNLTISKDKIKNKISEFDCRKNIQRHITLYNAYLSPDYSNPSHVNQGRKLD